MGNLDNRYGCYQWDLIVIYLYDKFSKVVVDFSSIRGQKLFGWVDAYFQFVLKASRKEILQIP